MKKIFSYAAVAFACLFCASTLNADQVVRDVRELDANHDGVYNEGEVDPCASYQCGPCVCYCPVTRFTKQNYCETQCVQEPYTCQKKCCRYVDKYYSKKCCRMVPQYYEKKCCRQVPEYYDKTCCRMISVPQYYTKRCCRQVPEYYSVTCCRQVPEYYCTQECRKCPEYYTECETKYRNKYIQVPKCCYKPYTCMEQRCIDAPLSCVVNAGRSNNNNYNNNNYSAAAPARHPRNGNGQLAMANETTTDMNAGKAADIQSAIEDKNLLGDQEYVDVIFFGGNVRLVGLVSSQKKKDDIGSFVKSYNGVRQVNNQLTIDSSLLQR